MKLTILLCILACSWAVSCGNMKQSLLIKRSYKANAYYENIYVWEGEMGKGKLVLSISGKDKANTVVNSEVCVSDAIHSIVLERFDNNGWELGSRMDVYSNGIPIAKDVLSVRTLKVVKVYPFMSLATGKSWKYSDTLTPNWYSVDFGDSEWTEGRAGSFNTIVSSVPTRYYRASVSIPVDRSQYYAIEVGIKTKNDYAIYMNGVLAMQNTVVPTEDDAPFRRISLPLDMVPQGNYVVIAASVSYGETHEDISDSFDGFVLLLSGGMHHVFEATYDSNHAADIVTEAMEYAWDSDLRSKWYFSSVPAYNTIVFDNDRRAFFNAYSVTSGTILERRPTKWVVEGSNDGEVWELLDQRDGIEFEGMYDTKMFKLPHNHKAYNAVRFTINGIKATEATAPGEVACFELFVGAIDYVSTPVLTYSKTAYDLFIDQDYFYTAPLSGGFKSFTMTGTLPTGLSFSAESGAIYGIPTTAATSSISISAQHATSGTTSYTTSFSITVSACGSGKTRFDIVKMNGGIGYDERLVLKQGDEVIDEHVGLNIQSTQTSRSQTYRYCLPSGVYQLVLSSDMKFDWSTSSYVNVNLYTSEENTITIVHFTPLSEEHYVVIPFNTALLVAAITEWNYKADGTVPSGWYSSSYSGSWPAVPSDPVTVSQSVWLFRKTITVSSITDYQGYELRLYARAGYVVYLNGVEIYRANVNGDVTASSVSTSTSTTNTWHSYSDFVGAGKLIQGNNVFAIAIVNANAASTTLDALFTIRLLSASGITTRGIDTTVTASHSNNDNDAAPNLFHGDYTKRWASTYTADGRTVTAIFTNDSKELINQFCFVAPWNALENTPVAFSVHTSTDGTNFVLAAEYSNLYWTRLYQRRCFALPNTTPIRGIRFIFTAIQSPSDNYQLNSIELNLVSNIVNIPSLTYPESSYVFYQDTDIGLICPTSDRYTGFFTSTILPEGIVISTDGCLHGIPTSFFIQAPFTISASLPSGSIAQVVITLKVVKCENTMTYVKLSMGYFDTNGDHAAFALTNPTETLYYQRYIPRYSRTAIYSFCFPNNLFTLFLLDRTNQGWTSTATYTLTFNDQVTTGAMVANSSPRLITYSSLSVINEVDQVYRYFIKNEAVPEDWYKPTFSGKWSTTVGGGMPNIVGITGYYCTTFLIDDASPFASYKLAVYTQFGYIAYMNGYEINRIRLPSTGVTKDTACTTTGNPVYVLYNFLAEVSNVVNGENLFCVEIHKEDTKSIPNDFNAYMKAEGSNRDVIIDGELSASAPGYHSGSYDERAYRAVDKLTSTKYYSDDGDCNCWLQWTFNEENKDQPNRLVYHRGTNLPRAAKKLVLSGSNDGTTWTSIMTQNDMDWTGSASYGSKSFTFLPVYPYHHYRAQFSECYGSDTGIEVGEWFMYAETLSESYCPFTDGIRGTLEGAVSEGPCPELYSGTISYLCQNGAFTEVSRSCIVLPPKSITYDPSVFVWEVGKAVEVTPTLDGMEATCRVFPALPAGLTLNDKTGVISGKPTVVTDETVYLVQLVNEGGRAITNITITVKEASKMGLIIIGIVAVVVIIVVIVVVIIVMKKKSKTLPKKGKLPKTVPKAVPKAVPKVVDSGAKIAV